MTREQRLSYCERCLKKDFSPNLGMVCSLTQERATFENTCADFDEDPKEARMIEIKAKNRVSEIEHEESMGLSVIGIKNGMWAGIIVMSAALLWLVLGLILLDRIFLYSFVLFAFGVLAFANGLKKRNQLKRRIVSDKDLLDV